MIPWFGIDTISDPPLAGPPLPPILRDAKVTLRIVTGVEMMSVFSVCEQTRHVMNGYVVLTIPLACLEA